MNSSNIPTICSHYCYRILKKGEKLGTYFLPSFARNLIFLSAINSKLHKGELKLRLA